MNIASSQSRGNDHIIIRQNKRKSLGRKKDNNCWISRQKQMELKG